MPEGLSTKQWFLISILLRLLIIPLTFHGDILFVNRAPHLLAHGEWNAYEIFLREYSDYGYYPPLAMLLFGFCQFILTFLFSGYEAFLHSALTGFTTDVLSADHLFLSLFLMKIPYLVFDCWLIRICWKMLPEPKARRSFMVFWAVNPIVIYGTYMMGQYDLVSAFTVVLACFWAVQRGKEHWACLALAAGCLLKLMPVVFLPLVILMGSRNMKDAVRLSLYGTVPIVIFYGGFYLISGDAMLQLFSDLSYVANTSTDYRTIFLRVCQAMVYALVLHHIWFKSRNAVDYSLAGKYFLLVYIAVYWGVVPNQTYYFIGFIPFLILFVQERPEHRKTFYSLILIIFLLGLRSRSSFIGIFAPVNPEFFLSWPSLKDVTGFLFNQETYLKAMKYLYLGVTAFWVVSIFKNLYRSETRDA